jgi:hypothetical protein
MQCCIVLAATLTVLMATGAQAAEWCGYDTHEKSVVECGYSSVAECESALGKGGMCFVDPDYAASGKRAAPMFRRPKEAAKPPSTNDGSGA